MTFYERDNGLYLKMMRNKKSKNPTDIKVISDDPGMALSPRVLSVKRGTDKMSNQTTARVYFDENDPSMRATKRGALYDESKLAKMQFSKRTYFDYKQTINKNAFEVTNESRHEMETLPSMIGGRSNSIVSQTKGGKILAQLNLNNRGQKEKEMQNLNTMSVSFFNSKRQSFEHQKISYGDSIGTEAQAFELL